MYLQCSTLATSTTCRAVSAGVPGERQRRNKEVVSPLLPAQRQVLRHNVTSPTEHLNRLDNMSGIPS